MYLSACRAHCHIPFSFLFPHQFRFLMTGRCVQAVCQLLTFNLSAGHAVIDYY
jgi:adenine deaminase